MPKKGGKTGGGAGGGDKRLQMFAAINKQKLEGVRWSFLYGGQQVSTRNDEGLTPLMVCAMENKNRALDNVRESFTFAQAFAPVGTSWSRSLPLDLGDLGSSVVETGR
eukprot:SAG31_NODE_802_length_12008_cov_18.741036_1_plen_108_part_00